MKYLVLLLVIALVFMLMGVKRRGPQQNQASRPGTGAGPKASIEMVRCAECGLHLPESEALPGRGGQFCCAEHRSRFEARHRDVQ
jgi:uncharacterized protein